MHPIKGNVTQKPTFTIQLSTGTTDRGGMSLVSPLPRQGPLTEVGCH